ncbi:uncharacterized protein LOC111616682 [Centruroides sculpturatus]|uniref:uncharacterized protein LOC111616682 n=1 Tax=Centruroides sculpturatus TaxID=218467 RepID=UPI000C6EA1CF|nr:uncharacterized protein LOC111616682 [Centruroides sculpturatus]
MAETTLEKTTETGAISPRGCTLITELPEIIIHIFQYLKDGELDVCRQVCTKWRDIIENIMYHRVTMMTRKIPFNIIITAIHESENLRPYVGFDDNFQYCWFVLGDKSDRPVLTTDDLKRFRRPTLEPIPSHKYTYFMHSYNPNSARKFFFLHIISTHQPTKPKYKYQCFQTFQVLIFLIIRSLYVESNLYFITSQT